MVDSFGFMKEKSPVRSTVHDEFDSMKVSDRQERSLSAAVILGVSAKLVVFPDEDHFINKPKNRKFWYDTVGEWLKSYTGLK